MSKVHAEGASLAVASFSVATAIVAGIGLVGGVALYMHPPIVHAMRDSTRRFARSIDNSLGAALRVRVEAVRNRGPIVSPEWQKRTGRGLTQAVGGHGLLGKSSTREDKARKPDGKDSA